MLRKFRGVVSTLTAVAVAGITALAVAPMAQAQYTAPSVSVESLFDFSAMALAVLTIIGGALAAVGGYKIAVGIGKKVIAWLGGRA